MNKINEFKYLKDWCDEYYKTVGLKIHPSNVPVDVVLDDIMGHITYLIAHERQFISWSDYTNDQIKSMLATMSTMAETVAQCMERIKKLEEQVNPIKKVKKDDKRTD